MLSEGLDAIWESSRHNEWSYAVPLVLNIGTAVLTLIAFLSINWLRWILTTLTIAVMAYAAIEYSSMEIEEKWRIRNQWIKANYNSLSELERSAGASDGANRSLGPILVGGFSAICRGAIVVVGLAIARYMLNPFWKSLRSKGLIPTDLAGECQVRVADPSNPYAPIILIDNSNKFVDSS